MEPTEGIMQKAANVLLQHQFLFSERKAAQLQWSRFINNGGKMGGNIRCNLQRKCNICSCALRYRSLIQSRCMTAGRVAEVVSD